MAALDIVKALKKTVSIATAKQKAVRACQLSQHLHTFFMPTSPKSIEYFSPAKVNLFLAITSLRDDGFHELLSLVAPLAYGDRLAVTYLQQETGPDTLSCDYPGVPTGPENLVLRAAAAFRRHVLLEGRLEFSLQKQTPPGAGLGGGSSNAAVALRAMNDLLGEPLKESTLKETAAELGSDCPLFLEGKATLMSGRGEQLEVLPEEVLRTISGRRIVLFRPSFGISTAWAYGKMKSEGNLYLPEANARERLNAWLSKPKWNTFPLYNNLQDAVFKKYKALPALLELLRERHGVRCMMSGSGSCCFALTDEKTPGSILKDTITEAFGENCFFAETQLL